MTKISITFIILSAGLVLSRCGDLAGFSSSVKIIGGTTPETTGFESVVALMQDELTLCSGTLIAPDLVLTAAHCVEKLATRGLQSEFGQLKIVAGPSSFAKGRLVVSTVKDVKIHPRFWQDHLGAMDFAWIRIDPPIDQIKPAHLPSSRRELDGLVDHASQLLIAGFGLFSTKPPAIGEDPPSGIKKIGLSPVHYRTGAEIFAGSQFVDSCTGDSGGPAFVAGPKSTENPSGLTLGGVTTRGPMPCASDFEAGAYGLTSEALCFLKSSAHYDPASPSDRKNLDEFCSNESILDGSIETDRNGGTMTASEACRSDRLSPKNKSDLAVLMTAAHLSPLASAKSCDDLQQFLSSTTKLDLSAKHLHSTYWLRFAPKLQTVNLSDNLITKIDELSQLSHLHMIDIRNNAITDLPTVEALASRAVVYGRTLQASNQIQTSYFALANKAAFATSDQKTLLMALRDLLVIGPLERKSRDLALKRQLNLERRGLRSIAALRGLENLEGLNLAFNPDIKDWSEVLSLPRLRFLRISATDRLPANVRDELKKRGVHINHFERKQ